jgi:hypothetical protein
MSCANNINEFNHLGTSKTMACICWYTKGANHTIKVIPSNRKVLYVKNKAIELLIPRDSNRDCIPINKYAKMMLIRKGVRMLPRKNMIKKADINNTEKTNVSSFEKIFLNKLFISSSTFRS